MRHSLLIIACLALGMVGCTQTRGGPEDLVIEYGNRPGQLAAIHDPDNQIVSAIYVMVRPEEDHFHKGNKVEEIGNTVWIYEFQLCVGTDSQEGQRLLQEIDMEHLGQRFWEWLPERELSETERLINTAWYSSDRAHPSHRFALQTMRENPGYRGAEYIRREGTRVPRILMKDATVWADNYLTENHNITTALDESGYPPVRRVNLWHSTMSRDEARQYLRQRFPGLRARDEYVRVYDHTDLGLEWQDGQE